MKRHTAGEKVSNICENMEYSRTWFYKWKKRFDSGKSNWFKEKSKAPKNPDKISDDLENLIIKIRLELMDKEFAHYGPKSIQLEIRRLEIKPPSISTIKRVIKDNDLVQKNTKYKKKGTPYPDALTTAIGPNSIHQVDFWGQKNITGDGRFYCLNIMDVYTRRVITYPARRKRTQEAVKGITKAWDHLGLPDYMQFDNALQFRGSNRYPRSFGKVIRLCLVNGIQPIFIPVSEPWRNGYIEKFNDTLNKKFFRAIKFDNYPHMCNKLKSFTTYHNNKYRYSPLGDNTPEEIYERDCLNSSKLKYKIPNNPEIENGEIHVIRLIRSNLKLNIFSETFDMPKKLEYEYVVATICTDSHMIRVYDNQLNSLFTLPYKIPNRCNSVNDVLNL